MFVLSVATRKKLENHYNHLHMKVDPLTIATVNSAHAMSMFTKYIKDCDESLTDVKAMTIAASIVQGLPMLFDANPEFFTTLMATLTRSDDF